MRKIIDESTFALKSLVGKSIDMTELVEND